MKNSTVLNKKRLSPSSQKKKTKQKKTAVTSRNRLSKKTANKTNDKTTPSCGATIIVGEQVGGEIDLSTATTSRTWPTKKIISRLFSNKHKRPTNRVTASTCAAFAAVGHTQREKLLTKLLEGPATYQTLKKATKLKPGPLYHHINQLRLAKLIFPKQRDVYELTRGGRNLILIAQAIGPLISSVRRRPLGI